MGCFVIENSLNPSDSLYQRRMESALNHMAVVKEKSKDDQASILSKHEKGWSMANERN